MSTIFVIHGKRNSGKTTLGKYIASKVCYRNVHPFSHYIYHFGDELKNKTNQIFNLNLDFNDRYIKDSILPIESGFSYYEVMLNGNVSRFDYESDAYKFAFENKAEKVEFKGITGRDLLHQTSDFLLKYDKNFLLNLSKENINRNIKIIQHVIIPDLRKDIEYDYLNSLTNLGHKVIFIKLKNRGDDGNHETDIELDDSKFNYLIDNSGTFKDLMKEMDIILERELDIKIQHDRICLNCNKGFDFNQLKEKREISFYQVDTCPYCNSMNHCAGLFKKNE